jgi:hypothetical protein
MTQTYGRQVLETTGRPRMVSADGKPEWKIGGVTIDWSLVSAVGSDTTLSDETIVKNGDKYMRYGQVIGLSSKSEVQTITFTGGPTAGDAIITLPASGDDAAEVAGAAAFNISAQAMQDLLTALPRIGQNGATVTRSGAGSAGDPYIYTVTFNRLLGNVPQFTATHTFTGGTSPTVTPGTSTAGAGTGLYGPIDTSASDGRQTLTRGECFILNETVVQSELGSDHPPVFDGGAVWTDRLLVGGTNQPTLANLLTAMPRLQPVKSE